MDALPYFRSHTVSILFVVYLVPCFLLLCFLLISLFQMAPKSSIEVLTSVPKSKKAVVGIMEKMFVTLTQF